MNFLIGTYIAKDDKSLYECVVNDTGIANVRAINAGPNPSFVCANDDKTVLYVVNEMAQDIDNSYGQVRSFLKNKNNKYEQTSVHSTEGNHPCHVVLHKDKKLLFVTNYTSGSLCVYSLQEDGVIEKLVQHIVFSGKSIHPERQESAHAHQTILSPCQNYVFVTDLGCDCIYMFKITSVLETSLKLLHTVKVPEGRGPRHMTFSMCKKYMYVSAELTSSVLVFAYNGILAKLNFFQEYKSFPDEANPYPRTSSAEIVSYKKNIYVSNRGDDAISVFTQNDDGTLSLAGNISCGGNTPRNFKIFSQTPWGGEATLVVANQDSNNIVFFSVEGTKLIQQKEVRNILCPAVVW